VECDRKGFSGVDMLTARQDGDGQLQERIADRFNRSISSLRSSFKVTYFLQRKNVQPLTNLTTEKSSFQITC
jgi:hypothetical protein